MLVVEMLGLGSKGVLILLISYQPFGIAFCWSALTAEITSITPNAENGSVESKFRLHTFLLIVSPQPH